MKKNKVLRNIGNFLSIVAICFITQQLWRSWSDIQTALNWKCVSVLFLFALCIITSLTTYAILYKKILEEMSGKAMGPECISKYLRANLYKYLPGNVMHYVGRNEIVADGQASFKQLNAGSVIEILVSVIAASAIALIFAGRYIIQYILFRWVIYGALVFSVALFIIVVLFRSKIINFLKDIITPKILRISGRMVVIYMIWNILGNVIFVFLLQVLGCEIAPTDYFPIIGIYSGVWLIGFLTPGVPGGIGVREAMLNVLLSGLIPTWAASLAGVLMRAAQILGELTAYVAAVFVISRYIAPRNGTNR